MAEGSDRPSDAIGRMLAGIKSLPPGAGGASGAPSGRRGYGPILAFVAAAIVLFLVARLSWVHIDADEVGHLKRIYAWDELPAGRIVALPGQKGPQARTLGPGFHLIWGVRLLYDVETFKVVTVPEGFYGQIIALDGQPMPSGMFMAPAIPDDKLAGMLDAESFLTDGGYRGPQETVLKPGRYRLNHYLFDVRVGPQTSATVIPAGQVGVVKSNVATPGLNCVQERVTAAEARFESDALSVPLVPRGCIGIWREPLLPGAYYLNRNAYEVTMVDTRVQTWEYKGGFVKRIIDLQIDQQGNLRQTERTSNQPVPKEAADAAVAAKVEGWDIPLELRALVQVRPENAPIVVGSVGGITEIEHRILTPAIRSIVRNVSGSSIRVPDRKADGTLVEPRHDTIRPTRVLDFIENRDAIEGTIDQLIRVEGRKAGIEVKEIRLGEPAIPPELLVARLRVQLADQLAQAFERETESQNKRTETEKARATANEQPRLVAAEIAVRVANQRENEQAALGRAERQFLEELARGQQAQSGVLGQDRVAMLQALDKILTSLERRPELVQLVGRLVPQTVVGSDAGFAGAAAILGQALGGQMRQGSEASPPAGAPGARTTQR